MAENQQKNFLYKICIFKVNIWKCQDEQSSIIGIFVFVTVFQIS